LQDARDGDIVTFLVTVESHQPPPRKRGAKLPYKIVCHTKQGFITLVFFHARPDYIVQSLPVGAERVVSGKFERYDTLAQITHPDIIAAPEEFKKIQALEPVYPLTSGLTNRHLGKIAASALALVPELPEWLDAAYITREGWQGWKPSLIRAHQPKDPGDILPASPARQRLAYDELLANQLALALVRTRLRKPIAVPIPVSAILRAKALAALPFQLTDGQKQVLGEIDADLHSGNRMLRLLQGDVGSGKTIVALLAALSAIEAKRQVALMVPTELLGKPHCRAARRARAAADRRHEARAICGGTCRHRGG
jgi:ATP-dependent DNA helicase RecG